MFNELSGWDDLVDPAAWQPHPTLFESAVAEGFQAIAVGPARYSDSGFTGALLRGAEYRSAETIDERFAEAAAWLREPGPHGILYLYVPELDMISHKLGWESEAWTEALESLDAAVRGFASRLRAGEGLVVTADHGMIDVPEHGHVFFDTDPELVDGIRLVAGEARCLQLFFDPELDPAAREELTRRWHESEDGRAWVVTKAEVIEAGWFGEVGDLAAGRMGDLFVAARKNIAYYDSRTATARNLAMVGHHGSWSPAEVQIPLARFGAYSR